MTEMTSYTDWELQKYLYMPNNGNLKLSFSKHVSKDTLKRGCPENEI
jgi:hypothetical protein